MIKIKEYCEQLCTHVFDNLVEMEQLLKKNKNPKVLQLIQYVINNLDSPVTVKEIKLILKLPRKK